MQAFLSCNPVHDSVKTGEKLLYCAFQKNGKILYGNELVENARKTPLKYCSSFPEVTELADLAVVKHELDNIYEQGYTPIFSQEDWGRRAGYFKNADFFSRLDCDIHAVVYVRPQVDWFNSAWWQWYAWHEKFSVPRDVIGAWGFNFMLWGNQIATWKRLARVQEVTVRLHPADIVLDFMELIGIQPSKDHVVPPKNNISLSPTLVKLLKRYPALRQTHSADVDSILSNFIKFEGKTPWFLEPVLVNQILENTKEDNLRLQTMLDAPSKVAMEQDQRWWDVKYYENRKVWSEDEFKLTENELFLIVEQVIPALLKLGREVPHAY